MIENTTILIKTFERPEAPARLIASIRNFYPEIPILVIDDGKNSMLNETFSAPNIDYIKTDFDIGLSAGRNLGVENVKTKYFFTCDDDNVFTGNTDLELAERLLESNNLDILGVKEEGNSYYGLFEDDGITVKYLNGNRGVSGWVTFYDFVPNLFLMKTESAKKFRWDDELKIGEHFAYFYKHKGNLKIGFTDHVSLAHDHIHVDSYSQYRDRAEDFVKKYMRENGIKRRVDLSGNIIEV